MNIFCRKYKSGFTLIELLVVISIIALLLSIIMPALTKAREQAKKIVCASHLKEMAYGMHLYAVTYKNTFPATFMPGNLSPFYPGFSHWHQLVMEFAESKKLLRCPSLNTKKLMKWEDNGLFMTGFGLNYTGWNWKRDSEYTPQDEPGFGFGYIVTKNPSPTDTPRGGCVTYGRVSRQSSFIMIGDSNGNKQTDIMTLRSNYTFGILGAPRVYGVVNKYGDMPDVHGVGGNIAFMDAHVKWYKTSQLMSDEMVYMWKRGK
jgi:prepilin-type N-terminal cleavage/methylation domain-containing protein/prepilin-type processing-associated H-X9-DG protein